MPVHAQKILSKFEFFTVNYQIQRAKKQFEKNALSMHTMHPVVKPSPTPLQQPCM
jgi:hypothetical protein